MKKVFYLLLSMLMLTACVHHPDVRVQVPFPDETVTFEFGYSTAFDRIIQALRAEGHSVAIADPHAGFILTEPKPILSSSVEASGPSYSGMYRIHVDGDGDHSWAVIDLLVFPELPAEREKLIQRLREGPTQVP